MESIFNEIKEERERQDRKWGVQNHAPIIWCAILGEEVGEVQKAALETYFAYEKSKGNYSEYREELIQTAAVAVAMIECLDRLCFQECTSCEKAFDIETMPEDDAGNYFCRECYKELAPVMKAEYDELVKKGEIEKPDNV